MGTFSPALIIGGSYKSGTTSLYRWIEAHPRFEASIEKEPQYFRSGETAGIRWHAPGSPDFATDGLTGYRQCWAQDLRPDAHLFEATPFYLYDQSALENLVRLESPPAIAFVLREPASRAFSLYNAARHKASSVPDNLSFSAVVDRLAADPDDSLFAQTPQLRQILRHGDYARYLAPWVEAFGSQVRVYWFDDLATDPLALLDDLVSWVDPSLQFDRSVPLTVANETTVSRFSGVRRQIRRTVQRSDSRLLAQLRKTEAAAAMYRRLNSMGSKPQRTEADLAAIAALKHRFQPANAALEQLGFPVPESWAGQEGQQ